MPTMRPSELILLAFGSGAVIMLVFLLIVQSRGVNTRANRSLAALLSIIGILLIYPTWSVSWTEGETTNLLSIDLIGHLCPLFLLLTVHFFVSPMSTPPGWTFLLVLPMIVEIATTLLFPPHPLFDRFYTLLLTIELLAILWYVLRKLKHHQRIIERLEADAEAVNLQWLYLMLLFAIPIFVGANLVSSFTSSSLALALNVLPVIAAVFLISYFAITQREIYPYSPNTKLEVDQILKSVPNQSTSIETVAPEPQERQISEPTLPGELTDLQQRLLQMMDQEHPYLDARLTLPDLARRLGTRL